MIRQGEVWWADLAEPRGSEPGFRRPVVVVQGDAYNDSRLQTAVCVVLTSNVRFADLPGNVRLSERETGLSKVSVANVSQLITLDRLALDEPVGKIPKRKLGLIFSGIDIMMGR